MKIYLARHGDYSMNSAQLDVLTDKGTKDTICIANFLNECHLHVADIFHSGKFRAQQTAELFTQGFICNKPIQIKNGLNPHDDVKVFSNEIENWQEDVLIIGHLPFMSRLAGKLLTGNENKEIIDFQTTTIACLEMADHMGWMIKWVLTPDLFPT